MWPCKDLAEAEVLWDLLASYDDYLFSHCENMRADYANARDLVFNDPEDPADTCSWYFDDKENNVFYDSFEDYLMRNE